MEILQIIRLKPEYFEKKHLHYTLCGVILCKVVIAYG